MDRISFETNLSVQQSVTIDTMLNFDGDFDRHGHGTCKQTLTVKIIHYIVYPSVLFRSGER